MNVVEIAMLWLLVTPTLFDLVRILLDTVVSTDELKDKVEKDDGIFDVIVGSLKGASTPLAGVAYIVACCMRQEYPHHCPLVLASLNMYCEQEGAEEGLNV